MLRQIYLKQGIGVGALRRIYGGAQRRGVRRKTTVKGAGGCIRHVLIQFEVRCGLWDGLVGRVSGGWLEGRGRPSVIDRGFGMPRV